MTINRTRILIIVVNLLLLNEGYAQITPVKVPKHSFELSAGLLNGEAEKVGAELKLAVGNNYKRLFVGVGTGVDYYAEMKSMPLFVDIRRDLKQKKNTPFIGADIGYNFPLRNKEDKNNDWVQYEFEGGLYYELSAGYKFSLTNLRVLSLSAGYSYKNTKENEILNYGGGPFGGPVPSSVNTFDFKFRRVSVKLGFWF